MIKSPVIKYLVNIGLIVLLASCAAHESRIHEDDYFKLNEITRYDEVVYQFGWSRSFHGHNEISVRSKNGKTFVRLVVHDVSGKEIKRFEKPLTNSEAEKFFRFVDEINFWSAVSPRGKRFEEGEFKCSYQTQCDVFAQLDGSVWRIDALHDGRRQSLEHWTPQSGVVYEFGYYFIDLVKEHISGDIY